MSRRSPRRGVRIHAIHAHRDVLARGEPRQKIRRLEHDAAIRARRDDFAAIERDAAIGDVGEPGDHRQHGGLAAARVPDQRNELALADVERELVDHGERPLRVGKRLGDVVELARTCRGSPRPSCALAARTAFGTKSLEVIGIDIGQRTRLSSLRLALLRPASMRYCVISARSWRYSAS